MWTKCEGFEFRSLMLDVLLGYHIFSNSANLSSKEYTNRRTHGRVLYKYSTCRTSTLSKSNQVKQRKSDQIKGNEIIALTNTHTQTHNLIPSSLPPPPPPKSPSQKPPPHQNRKTTVHTDTNAAERPRSRKSTSRKSPSSRRARVWRCRCRCRRTRRHGGDRDRGDVGGAAGAGR